MSLRILTLNYTAESAVQKHRLVAFGGSDGSVVHASPGVRAIGSTVDLGAAAGRRVDVDRIGLSDVVLGGVVSRGDYLTAGADGVAVAAAAEDADVVGMAEQSGVSGDLISYLILPSSL